MTDHTTPEPTDDVKLLEDSIAAIASVREQLARMIVGQSEVIDQLLIAMLARGHCLVVGVPGLAKTLMIRSLAETLSLEFRRIQFTPDLMPSDITGTEIIDEDRSTGTRQMRYLKGPIFGNVILADEINRTPPKTQAALLEAMQEHQVTIGGTRYPLDEPFFVLATQNPIEQEGTYPLPEAQLDRFMLDVRIDYPSESDELAIVRRTTVEETTAIEPVLSGDQILAMQRLVRRLPVSDEMIRFALRLSRRTRPGDPKSSRWVNSHVRWGAGPRASQYLILAAKAWAVLRGRSFVTSDDIREVAHPVLRHRIIPNFTAEAEGIDSDAIIDQLLESVEPPGADDTGQTGLPDLVG